MKMTEANVAKAQKIQCDIEELQGRVQKMMEIAEASEAERCALANCDAGLEKAYMALAEFT